MHEHTEPDLPVGTAVTAHSFDGCSDEEGLSATRAMFVLSAACKRSSSGSSSVDDLNCLSLAASIQDAQGDTQEPSQNCDCASRYADACIRPTLLRRRGNETSKKDCEFGTRALKRRIQAEQPRLPGAGLKGWFGALAVSKRPAPDAMIE